MFRSLLYIYRMNRADFIILTYMLLIPAMLHSQSGRILMDGEFSDWDEVSYLYMDSVGDVAAGGVDFGGLKMLNDETFLYLYIELNFEINLKSFLNSTLYLDTDNDSATGFGIENIGAELTWNFAAKSGMFYSGTDSIVIGHTDIRLRTFPTVSSEIFEISIGLDSKPDGSNDLFTGEIISVLVIDADGSDMLPDSGVHLVYTILPVDLEPIVPIRISDTDSSLLRFLTWNVHGDDLFDPNLFDEYDRILSALNPEIIAFQEIYSHNTAELKELMESILPSGDGEEWFTLIDGNDIALASRYSILNSWFPNNPNRAFLVELKPEYSKNLLVIGAHFPCCLNDSSRQNEIDGIMAFLRDALQPGGVIDLEENTPVILAGDFNLVGERRQLETLLTGDILDNSTWGSDFSPDWDGTNLSDAIPRHTDLLQTYTWRNDNSPFSPGRLDFIIYTDSAIKLENSFVLWTEEMSADTLNAYGLVSSDTRFASDHLPVVVDFSLEAGDPTAISGTVNMLLKTPTLNQNYPNPFNSSTQIEFFLPLPGFTKLVVHDLRGREIAILTERYLTEGSHAFSWNADDVPSGLYFYTLTTADYTRTEKMLLLK